MPIVSGSYAPSAAPVSGQCQTTYMIEHYAQKVERRLASNNALISTEYIVDKDVIRLVQCVDPLKRDQIFRMEIEPERLVFTQNGADLSGRATVEETYATRMSYMAELRCNPCSGAEVSGAAYKSYRVTYDGLDFSSQTAAKTEYELQDRFHTVFEWTPTSVLDFYNPDYQTILEVLENYDNTWGTVINTALGTTSFFTPCATETASTGCVS